MRHRLAAWVQVPLVHFVALGAVLAIGRTFLGGGTLMPARVIVVTPEVAHRVAAGVGVAADTAAGRAALDTWIDDEVLYREGLRHGLAWNPSSIARLVQVGRFVGVGCADDEDALAEVHRAGLDREDPGVRALVVGKMRLRLAAEATSVEPADEVLEGWYRTRAQRFARPARTTFAHVFIRRDAGSVPDQTLAAIARRVRDENLPVERAVRLGDVFGPGERFVTRSRPEVEALLGAEVAQVAMTQPVREWSAPVRSAYGWHLLWVEARTEAERPALAAVRDRVRREWQAEGAKRLLAARMRELRQLYRVEIEAAAEARLPGDDGWSG